MQNPDHPEAAKLFHELNQAYELLLDPLRRLALDQKLRVKEAKKERYKAYDAKRKHMVEELERRERATAKKTKMGREEEMRVINETERIKEEGRRLRAMKQAQVDQAREDRAKDQNRPPEQGMSFCLIYVYVKVNSARYTGHNSPTQMVTQEISKAHNPRVHCLFAFVIWKRRHGVHCPVPE